MRKRISTQAEGVPTVLLTSGYLGLLHLRRQAAQRSAARRRLRAWLGLVAIAAALGALGGLAVVL